MTRFDRMVRVGSVHNGAVPAVPHDAYVAAAAIAVRLKPRPP